VYDVKDAQKRVNSRQEPYVALDPWLPLCWNHASRALPEDRPAIGINSKRDDAVICTCNAPPVRTKIVPGLFGVPP